MDSTGRPALAETYISDISEGGIRFRADHFIPVRDRLYFNLNIPSKKPVMITAKPAWITEIPSINQYEIGARFDGLSDEDRAEIRDLVRNSK